MPNPQPIARTVDVGVASVTISNVLANSTPIPFARGSALCFTTPAGASGTVTWYASETQNGTYTPVILPSGLGAVNLSIAALSTHIAPLELFSCCFLKAVTNGSPMTCTVVIKQ